MAHRTNWTTEEIDILLDYTKHYPDFTSKAVAEFVAKDGSIKGRKFDAIQQKISLIRRASKIEGVETKDELGLLKYKVVDYYQGLCSVHGATSQEAKGFAKLFGITLTVNL